MARAARLCGRRLRLLLVRRLRRRPDLETVAEAQRALAVFVRGSGLRRQPRARIERCRATGSRTQRTRDRLVSPRARSVAQSELGARVALVQSRVAGVRGGAR